LVGDRADRLRYADMHTRFVSAPVFGALIGGVSLLTSVWAGWPLVVLVVLAALVMQTALRVHRRTASPELVGAAAFALLELDLALSALVSGGAGSPLLPLMAVPVFTQTVCFRPGVIWAFVAGSAALATAAAAAAPLLPPTPPVPDAVHLVAYVVLLCALALAAQFLATSDRHSRDRAVVDPLTGLMNRGALASRFAEIRAQGGPVAVVMCDVDRFKQVNDVHGHERGDAVLRELAARVRTAVRRADLVHRVGGEELLVLLPGHDAGAAVAVAERVRAAVASAPLAGLDVTLSAGVAAAGGGDVALEELSSAADRALYEAKRGGRNRVCAAAVTLP
jgi:diguanylate cyclase (GGDEF)-like protein